MKKLLLVTLIVVAAGIVQADQIHSGEILVAENLQHDEISRVLRFDLVNKTDKIVTAYAYAIGYEIVRLPTDDLIYFDAVYGEAVNAKKGDRTSGYLLPGDTKNVEVSVGAGKMPNIHVVLAVYDGGGWSGDAHAAERIMSSRTAKVSENRYWLAFYRAQAAKRSVDALVRVRQSFDDRQVVSGDAREVLSLCRRLLEGVEAGALTSEQAGRAFEEMLTKQIESILPHLTAEARAEVGGQS